MNFRQVHLDFHTSEAIENVGSEFDKKEFQEALKRGNVNSVTLFSKCHHGWSYHPTEVNEMHPHLNFDLLGAQLEACREVGINAPVYLSAGWDEKDAAVHPEWLVRRIDDTPEGPAGFVEDAGYHLLCYNTPYQDKLLAEIEEVMIKYHPEGIFLDISSVHPCYCAQCRKDILARGKDPRDLEAVMEQAELVYQNYGKRVMETVRKYSDTCTVFHNGGHIGRGRRDLAAHNTHLELESLPTGGWGYEHFPMSAAYVSNLGMEYLGMTGKFHNTWGEFGGFKHPNALLYETSLSLAYGAKCSIGDQLHPLGKMDHATYNLIGAVYKEVEKKEPWCEETSFCADIGVISEEAVNSRVSDKESRCDADTGANRILLEGKYLFQFIDEQEKLEKYKLIVLPDNIRLNHKLKEKLEVYLARGGKILATGISGLAETKDEFALNIGADYAGENEYSPNYVIWADKYGAETARVMYEQAYSLENITGTPFIYGENSYFNRDIRHFSSHQHTPNDTRTRFVAGVRNENIIYISWKIFTDYILRGSLHDKQIVMQAIDSLLGDEKTICVKMPDRGIVTLRKQEKEKRYIIHLLFAHTTIRGKGMLGKDYPVEVIEDIVPLYNVQIKVKPEKKIKKVYQVPEQKELQFEEKGDRIEFTIDEVNCHQMVVLDWE